MSAQLLVQQFSHVRSSLIHLDVSSYVSRQAAGFANQANNLGLSRLRSYLVACHEGSLRFSLIRSRSISVAAHLSFFRSLNEADAPMELVPVV